MDEKIISGIAKKYLGFNCLETTKSDSLDFREVAVWNVKDALEEAFDAGRLHCLNSENSKKIENYKKAMILLEEISGLVEADTDIQEDIIGIGMRIEAEVDSIEEIIANLK